jgi:hypothetical protein
LSIAGRGLFSDTVRFLSRPGCSRKLVVPKANTSSACSSIRPAPNEPSLLDRLQGRTQLAPVSFQMTLSLDLGSAARQPA